MRILLSFIFLITLVSCSSSPMKSYTLVNKNKIENSQYINYKNRKIAIIDNVIMPNEIDSSGIAYQTSPNEINIANNNVWAYSLSEQITDQLIAQLNNKQSKYFFNKNVTGLNTLNVYRLKIYISDFQGRFDGNAIISGTWLLLNSNGNIIKNGSFNSITPLKKEGYSALVFALSKSLDKISSSLSLGL